MKALIKKIKSVKKRQALKKLIGVVTAGYSLRSSKMLHETEQNQFFVNYDQSKPSLERPYPYQQSMIKNNDNKSSIETQSSEEIRGVEFGTGGRLIFSKEKKQPNQSEFTSSQEEVDALGLGKVNKEVTLVVGLPLPHFSPSPLAGHEKNWDQLIQESNIPIHIEQKSRIVMSQTSSDLTNRKWIQKFICSIRAGGSDDALDEELIRSILSKVAQSELDIPSINKILKSIANAAVSVGSNDKLMKILKELQNPMQPSIPEIAVSTEVVKIPDKLQDYQPESKSSSSIFVEGFKLKLPSHRKPDRVDWKKENKFSTPSAVSVFDSTKCYAHREGFNTPRSVTEQFESNAVKKLAKTSLKNPRLQKEYLVVQSSIEEGIHPVNLSEKSTYVSSTKVLVKKSEGRYIVDVSDTTAEILAVSSRTDDKCIQKFEKLMNKLYGLDLKGY